VIPTTVEPPVTAEAPVQKGGRRRATRLPYWLLLPAILYVALLVLVPLGQGIWLSLTDSRLLRPLKGDFIGLENFEDVVTHSRFWGSVFSTFLYTAGTVFGTLVLGTAAAVLMNRSFRARGIVRAILAIPYATPTVAVALVFAWIYAANGVLNTGTAAIGIGEVGWLTDPQYAMPSVIVATVWKVAPFVMLVVLAALQSVPEEVLEASRIDGANAADTFRFVVLPHIGPTLRILALLMTIWSIRRFEVIYLLTGGGPVDSTNTLVINIYRTAFGDQRLGEASAIGVISLLISLLVTIVFFVVERRQAAKEES
jgi:multiple sugar transport system permease protein